MTARHARSRIALAVLAVACAGAAPAAPPGACETITVREGDPVPAGACAVNVVPRDPGPAGMLFGGPEWAPLDPQTMPGVFYDSASIKPVTERPAVMAVTVAWFYAQPRISETNGQSYRSVTQPVSLNCEANTYTVDQTLHYAGENATGKLVESLPTAGIRNAPIAHDPVQRRLRELVCPAGGRGRLK
ncbi:MAG: surface-adhesin E family protein [Achromobacter sp.]|uniref:surface-adhesin E family protein n=1 Tax=Achromobacter sp. TaxID=134375 RepID=UPI003D07A70E